MRKKKQELPKEDIVLTEEQIANNANPTEEPKAKLSIPWFGLIIIGIIIILMVVCIVIIGVNGGF